MIIKAAITSHQCWDLIGRKHRFLSSTRHNQMQAQREIGRFLACLLHRLGSTVHPNHDRR
jgi:hypothetical protein